MFHARNIRMNRSILPRSGINSALFQREGDPVDGQHVCGDAIVDFVKLRIARYFLETALEDFLEPLIHFLSLQKNPWRSCTHSK